ERLANLMPGRSSNANVALPPNAMIQSNNGYVVQPTYEVMQNSYEMTQGVVTMGQPNEVIQIPYHGTEGSNPVVTTGVVQMAPPSASPYAPAPATGVNYIPRPAAQAPMPVVAGQPQPEMIGLPQQPQLIAAPQQQEMIGMPRQPASQVQTVSATEP